MQGPLFHLTLSYLLVFVMVSHGTSLQAHHSNEFFAQSGNFLFSSVNLIFFKGFNQILIVTELKIKTLLAKSSFPGTSNQPASSNSSSGA